MQVPNARHIYVGICVGNRWSVFALMPRARQSDGAAPAFPFDADAGKVFLRSMNTVTSRQVTSRQLAVPNLLTYARIAAVPAVVACLYWQDILQGGLWLRWVAVVIFISAGVTDALDGYFARKRGEQSAFGRMLDPIADKLLVASCLLMLAADGTMLMVPEGLPRPKMLALGPRLTSSESRPIGSTGTRPIVWMLLNA